jgi:hypothetical protein
MSQEVSTNPDISEENRRKYLKDILLKEMSGNVIKILEKINNVDKRVHKSNYQKSSDIVTHYFDPENDSIILRITGWLLMGIWYYLFTQFFHFLYIFLKFLFYLIIFLMLFIPLMCIGLVFLILILVMITVWMSSKSFLDAFIRVVNPIIPVPLIIWNIIASFFNAISSFARKFGGRFPRMPTVRNPNSYRIKKGVPSIYSIINFVVKPLKAAAWKQVVKHVDD